MEFKFIKRFNKTIDDELVDCVVTIWNERDCIKIEKEIGFMFELKKFRLFNIDLNKLRDMNEDDIIEWDSLIKILNLTEISPEIKKCNVDYRETENGYSLMVDHKNVGKIIESNNCYQLTLYSQKLILDLKWDLIVLYLETTTNQYHTLSGEIEYKHHDITNEKLLELALSQDFSLENIELKLGLVK